MISEPRDRDVVLRRALVAAVEAPPVPRRPGWRLAALSVGAFAIAGALTGGALTLSAGWRTPVPLDPSEVMPSSFLEVDATLLDAPWGLSASGGTVVELPGPPAGATHLAVAMRCLDPGAYELLFDGRFDAGTECEEGSQGGGGFMHPLDQLPRSIEVKASGDAGRLGLAFAWVAREPDPDPSPEVVAALADGTVTEEEYRAGFERFALCMDDAGFPLLGIDRSKPVIDYTQKADPAGSAADRQCYVREFSALDSAWQLAQQP